ncbi:hypothetical protein HID58_051967 [Brassica napus]|uniref:Uncharacterized protein n=1 Tax=Brassica napus TaxID=3708 RepID=A0ABQ8ABB3_BRANA|nr:hypothetical protein HID58_051967 [Brassica napus]
MRSSRPAEARLSPRSLQLPRPCVCFFPRDTWSPIYASRLLSPCVRFCRPRSGQPR